MLAGQIHISRVGHFSHWQSRLAGKLVRYQSEQDQRSRRNTIDIAACRLVRSNCHIGVEFKAPLLSPCAFWQGKFHQIMMSAVAYVRFIGPMHAKAVDRFASDIRNVAVRNLIGIFRERQAFELLFPGVIE